jgi:peroxiredoxin Q/BCP
MTMLHIGDKAPAFSLPDQDGVTHTLSETAGKWTLLYFYPKDATPGCTVEAQTIRDAWPNFTGSNIVVFGISADSVASHKKFAEKQGLPFTLLADEGKEMVQAYGVWGKKKMMGREYDGIFRTSFLIAPDGTIAKIYEEVKPSEHAAEVLKDVAELS